MFIYLSNWLSLYCLRKESETITFISRSWANCVAGVDTLTDVVSGKGCGGDVRGIRQPEEGRESIWTTAYAGGKPDSFTDTNSNSTIWESCGERQQCSWSSRIIINSAVPVLRVKSVNHLLLFDNSQGILTIQMIIMVRSWPLTMKWAQILVPITRLKWFSKMLYTRIINK